MWRLSPRRLKFSRPEQGVKRLIVLQLLTMELLTPELREQLPKLYAQEKKPDAIAHVKFFDPCGS
jgi:hypothetical protein